MNLNTTINKRNINKQIVIQNHIYIQQFTETKTAKSNKRSHSKPYKNMNNRHNDIFTTERNFILIHKEIQIKLKIQAKAYIGTEHRKFTYEHT